LKKLKGYSKNKWARNLSNIGKESLKWRIVIDLPHNGI
jgi:hypothetical protein